MLLLRCRYKDTHQNRQKEKEIARLAPIGLVSHWVRDVSSFVFFLFFLQGLVEEKRKREEVTGTIISAGENDAKQHGFISTQVFFVMRAKCVVIIRISSGPPLDQRNNNTDSSRAENWANFQIKIVT